VSSNKIHIKRKENLDENSESLTQQSKKRKLDNTDPQTRKRAADEIEEHIPEKQIKNDDSVSTIKPTQNGNHFNLVPNLLQNEANEYLNDTKLNVPIQFNDLTENLKKLILKTRNQDGSSDMIDNILVREFSGSETAERKKVSAHEVILAVGEVIADLDEWPLKKWKSNKDTVESLLKASFDVISCVDENLNEESKQNLKKILFELDKFLKMLI